MKVSRSVLITGGSRGIGAATARLAAAAGYKAALSYRSNQAAAEQVVSEIRHAGGEALAIRADVAVEADILRLFETVDQAWGPIDALVNNAGILERQTRLDAIDAVMALVGKEWVLARIDRALAYIEARMAAE